VLSRVDGAETPLARDKFESELRRLLSGARRVVEIEDLLDSGSMLSKERRCSRYRFTTLTFSSWDLRSKPFSIVDEFRRFRS